MATDPNTARPSVSDRRTVTSVPPWTSDIADIAALIELDRAAEREGRDRPASPSKPDSDPAA